jgi:hypothetical protein
MGRIGCLLMGFGFLAAWLLPVAGVLIMAAGGIATASVGAGDPSRVSRFSGWP